uniref:Calcium-dependent secretion activator n=1 Tax=Bactrocera latifrons TaxID=174628 RepID=A0A0K8U3Y9_BACLA
MIDPSSSEEEGDDDPVVVAPKGRTASSTSNSKPNVNATTNADVNFSSSKYNGDHLQNSAHKSFGGTASASGNAELGTGAASGNSKLEHGTHMITSGDVSGNLEVPNSAISSGISQETLNQSVGSSRANSLPRPISPSPSVVSDKNDGAVHVS